MFEAQICRETTWAIERLAQLNLDGLVYAGLGTIDANGDQQGVINKNERR